MAQRTQFELKTFLDGTYAQYSAMIDKTGVLFFDRTNHAVYAEDMCVIKSNVADVAINGAVITVTKQDGTQVQLDTTIPNLFVRFDQQQSLTDVQKLQARSNIGAEAADGSILKQKNVVNNLGTESTTAPLSAAQGKILNETKVDKVNGKQLSSNDYTTTEKTKLAGIEAGAQKNKINTIAAGEDDTLLTVVSVDNVKLMGNLMSSSEADAINGNIYYNLSYRYDANDKKLRFFNTETAPTTGVAGQIFAIDTTDFVKSSVIKSVSFDPDTNVLTMIFGTDSGDETINVDLSGLVDNISAGDGLKLESGVMKVMLGSGLSFDSSKAITLSLKPGGGLKLNANKQLEVDFTAVTSLNDLTGDIDIEGKQYVLDSDGEGYHRAFPITAKTENNKIVLESSPEDILALALKQISTTSDARVVFKGATITEKAREEQYSIVVDMHAKVWEF